MFNKKNFFFPKTHIQSNSNMNKSEIMSNNSSLLDLSANIIKTTKNNKILQNSNLLQQSFLKKYNNLVEGNFNRESSMNSLNSIKKLSYRKRLQTKSSNSLPKNIKRLPPKIKINNSYFYNLSSDREGIIKNLNFSAKAAKKLEKKIKITHKFFDKYDKNFCIIERKFQNAKKKLNSPPNLKDISLIDNKNILTTKNQIKNKIYNDVCKTENNLKALYSKGSYNNSAKDYIKTPISNFNCVNISNSTNSNFNMESTSESTKNTLLEKNKISNSNYLDGPEDIHYRFVELNRQTKIYFIDLSKKINKREFGFGVQNREEYSEISKYFDNFLDEVPTI
jgi:hypothetical protein